LVWQHELTHLQGIAFLEYADSSVTNVAIQGLNNMTLGERALKVQKASIGITQVAGEMGVNAMSMLAGTTSTDSEVSRVLQLLNMVTPDELMDNDDYEGKPVTMPTPPSPSFPTNATPQKFVRMSRRNAKSLAPFYPSRSQDRSGAAGNQPVWARFTSNTRLPRWRRRL
jgi:hypothetical protein